MMSASAQYGRVLKKTSPSGLGARSDVRVGTRRAQGVRMHHLSFVIKRVHHRLLAFARPFAKFFGITPARYDLLKRIRLGGGGFQAELPANLGVTRATISRMLISLEKLGLIVRTHLVDERGRPHRRMNWVALTAEGKRIMTAIDESLVYPWFQTAFEQFFMSENKIKQPAAAFAVQKLFVMMNRMSTVFLDTAYVRFYRPNFLTVFTRVHWRCVPEARRYRPDEMHRTYELRHRYGWPSHLRPLLVA